MRVREAERERRVRVRLRLDEGDLPVAPVDRHPPLQRQAARRERREAPGDVLALGQRREQRAGREDESRRGAGDPGGDGA